MGSGLVVLLQFDLRSDSQGTEGRLQCMGLQGGGPWVAGVPNTNKLLAITNDINCNEIDLQAWITYNLYLEK